MHLIASAAPSGLDGRREPVRSRARRARGKSLRPRGGIRPFASIANPISAPRFCARSIRSTGFCPARRSATGCGRPPWSGRRRRTETPWQPAPARTVRINLTAASRQRIQSGATLLADRLRLRRRSRQRNAIAKALAHEAVGQWSARSNPHRPRADFPKWLPTLRPLPAAAAHHRERASRRYRPRVLRGASPRSRLSRCESSARL